jgi:GntR family transcriptional regulator
VHELVRSRSLDGIPILVDHSLIPAALTPGLDRLDFRTESLYRVLATQYGCAPVRAELAIESRTVQPAYAAHLGLDDHGPVLEIQQVTYDQAGRIVQWCRSVYRGDRYKFRAVLEAGGGTQLTRRTAAETGRRPTF